MVNIYNIIYLHSICICVFICMRKSVKKTCAVVTASTLSVGMTREERLGGLEMITLKGI